MAPLSTGLHGALPSLSREDTPGPVSLTTPPPCESVDSRGRVFALPTEHKLHEKGPFQAACSTTVLLAVSRFSGSQERPSEFLLNEHMDK